MRTYGSGTIEALSRGRFRGRLPGQKGRRLPIRATREEAEEDLRIAVVDAVTPTPAGTPLAAFGRRVLLARELNGYSNAGRELSRWTAHVERTPLGARSVQALVRSDVAEWLASRLAARVLAGHRAQLRRPRTLSRSVVVDALRILRSVIRVALDEQVIREDPTAGVRVPRARGRTHDPWTYLRPAEVAQLLEVAAHATVERDRGGLGRRTARVPLVHPEDADAARVALFAGLREGELWCLHLADVDLERGRIVVRYGGRRGAVLAPTKGRKPRTLVLLAPALDALRRQLARLATPAPPPADPQLIRCESCGRSQRAHAERRPSACADYRPNRSPRPRENPERLVFPSLSRGRPGYRAEGRPPACWQAWLHAAGLDRGREDPAPVTWHSLRHTFATLALAGRLPGAEGEGWRIERVSAYLGHTSIAVTQRYADVAALL